MPEDPMQSNDPKPNTVTPEQVRGIVQELLTPLTEQLGQLPGMVKRLTNEAVQSIKPTQESPKKKEEQATNPDVEALRAELRERDARDLRTRVEAQIVEAMSGMQFVKGFSPSDYKGLIAGQVQQDENGNLTMEVEKELPHTKTRVKERVPVSEGVKHFFEGRKYLLASAANGGPDTGSTGSGASARPTSFKELHDNPKAMAHWMQEDPQLVISLQDEYNKDRLK